MLELSTFLGRASIFVGSAASNASISIALLIIIFYKNKVASHLACAVITFSCIWMGTKALYYGSLVRSVVDLGLEISTAQRQAGDLAVKCTIVPLVLLAVASAINLRVNSRARRIIIAVALWLVMSLYYGATVSILAHDQRTQEIERQSSPSS